jgi:hypothetical protein
MQSVTDLVLEQHRNKLKQGAVLVDHADAGLTPRVLFLIDHAVREGDMTRTIWPSRRMQFVEIDPAGQAIHAGWAPHLDLEAATPDDIRLIDDVLNAGWLSQNLEQLALNHASTHLVPEHFEEVRHRRESSVDKTLAAVHERLVREINFWSDRYVKLQDDGAAGKDVRLNLENVRRTIDDLTARRQSREQELLAKRHVISATPVVVGGALVIPAGTIGATSGNARLVGGCRSQSAGGTAGHAGRHGRGARHGARGDRRIGAEMRVGCDQPAQGRGWTLAVVAPY